MISQIVKKQALLLWRNPVQILLLVGLPIILIAILSTALGSMMMSGGASNINMKIAFVEHGDEDEEIQRFLGDLENRGVPPKVVEEIEAGIEQLSPVQILKDSVLGSGEVSEFIEIHEVKPSALTDIWNDNSYTSVIEVPENFTYESLEYMVLDNKSQAVLEISQNDDHQIGPMIVNDIVEQFQEQLTLGTFLQKNGIDQQAIQLEEGMLTGEVLTLNQKKPIGSQEYYAVGMTVMNVLFIASTIGTIAFMEKKIHVFDRIILGNISRWEYFIGVLISGTLFSFIHLLIVYGFSWVVYGVRWPDLLSFFTVTASLAIAVGGIAVLLTAISYRFNSEAITNFFAGIVVTMMAVLGGSFFPIGDSSAFFRSLGNLTPNGAGMSSYLMILRGDGLSEISHHILFLVLFAITSIIIAAISFPKRGASV
ncbi:ABC transporter permease [Oceanobacillus profundus]|uniref:ABC transporter permease n=1 Tax=Oceanobacillus TaxID=182709 RepID=UPI0026E1AE16|nr:ABC transporter permease [Oceanobacillus profundus]MDO6450318.1 ABC transporter permease [Oceanobacillus profundus]